MNAKAVCQDCQFEGTEGQVPDDGTCPVCGSDEVYIFEPVQEGKP